MVTVIATGFPPARRESVSRHQCAPAFVRDRGDPVWSGTIRSPRQSNGSPVEIPVGDDDLRRPAYLRRKARKLS
jgi:hypothetical protein